MTEILHAAIGVILTLVLFGVAPVVIALAIRSACLIVCGSLWAAVTLRDAVGRLFKRKEK